MSPVILALVVAIVVGGLLFWVSRRTSKTAPGEIAVPKTVANLGPGDALAFWDGQNCVVDAVLDCTEQVGSRVTRWQWVVLNDNRMLEVAPDGNTVFAMPDILYQGSASFEQLTTDNGVLKTFEQRVREGVAGSQPVHFRHGQSNYQIKSTGTFTSIFKAETPTQEVLRDIGPNAGDNVYFEMEGSSGSQALGIWTSHIAWYTGQPLKESDIVSIYPKRKEGRA